MDLLKSYPSGKVTATRRKRIPSQPALAPQPESDETDFDIRQMQIHGIEAAIAGKNSLKGKNPLGLSSVANLSTEGSKDAKPLKSPRGSGGITSKSRQQIKDAATLLEEEYGRSQLAFITHTIPPQFIDSVHANWVKILANLRRRYTRLLKKADLPQDLIMVSEYQEKRMQKVGIPVLHLHIVFVGRFKKQHWSYDVSVYKKLWQQCCSEYCDDKRTNAEWQSATRVEGIRKSCAAYLSKYMSKGVSAISIILAANPNAYIPPSWHILSQILRIRVRRETRHFEGESARTLFDWILENAVELLKFNRFIKIPTQHGRERCVGWYGELRDKTLFRTLVA